jgi:DNA-binding phage protein
MRTTLAIGLLCLAAPLLGCTNEPSLQDQGATLDFTVDATGAEAGPDALVSDASPTSIVKVLLLGATPDKDFKTNGLVTFTVFPTTASGSAVIDQNIVAVATAKTPTGLTATVESKVERRPPAEPLIATLLFDSSGSMSGNDPKRLRVEAGKQFIDQLGADDQIAVADFGAGQTGLFKATRLLTDFTTDKAAAKAAVEQVKSSGGTPMFESVSEVLIALNLRFPAANHKNRALVVLGDGEPNGSGTLGGSCIWAGTTKVPINVIGFGPAAYQSKQANLTAIWNLGALAGCSGGAYSSVAAPEDLSKTYTAIGQLLKKGAMEITVKFSPTPSATFVSGTLGLGLGAQAPVEVNYTFYAP